MVIHQKLPEIRGDVIKKAREAKGISIHQISKELCFSVKQIEQIEAGERSHFYSLAIKVAAAKKVADYLGVDYQEVFDFGPDLVQQIEEAKLSEQSTDQNSKVTETVSPIEKTEPIPTIVSEPEKSPESLERFEEINENSRPKKSKTKYVFLVFAVIVGAIVFSIDFPVREKVIEPPLAKLPTETIGNNSSNSEKKEDLPSTVPPSVTPAIVSNPSPNVNAETCPPLDANQTTYRSPSPSKAGNMIYISSKIKQVVCVRDASGKLEKKLLEVNGSHSFYGKAPFVLMTSGLAQADIFFQGYRVRLEDQNANSVVLEEVPF
jgi:transcriptional regulator with XRE-family HTH domain